MKLSDAMREGAKIRPQYFGVLRGTLGNGCVGTCAVGAAYEFATGFDPATHLYLFTYHDVVEAFPILNRALPHQQIGDYEIFDLHDLIAFKNDAEHRTREEIAEWLAQEGY